MNGALLVQMEELVQLASLEEVVRPDHLDLKAERELQGVLGQREETEERALQVNVASKVAQDQAEGMDHLEELVSFAYLILFSKLAGESRSTVITLGNCVCRNTNLGLRYSILRISFLTDLHCSA